MLDKIKDGFNVFRYGQQVTNPALWKAGGNAVSVLVPLIMGLVKLAGDFGYGVQLSLEQATAIATGIVAVWMFITNNITSRKAGLLPAKQSDFPELHSEEAVPMGGSSEPTKLQPVTEAPSVAAKPLTEQEARAKY